MIITLKGADFSSNNIGTLSTWTIFTSIGSGATYEGVRTVDKGASFSALVTIADGYEIGSAGVSVMMGTTDITSSAVKTTGNEIEITIGSVTGNVTISVPTVNTSTGEEGGDVVEPDTPATGTITELTFETPGFYNNSSQGGGVTSPNASWLMSDLIPIDTLTNNSDGYCTSMLQGHSKVAVVYYASSNNIDASAFLGNYGTTTQGEQAQYTAEQVKENAPEGTTHVGFSTHSACKPLHVYVIQ